MNDLASILTAIASLITSIAVLISVLINRQGIKGIHDEVKTANSLTLAQLADRTETRRIDKIAKKDQTNDEKTHVREVPEL